MNEHRQRIENVLLTLGVLALAGYIAFLGAPQQAVALLIALGGPALLWRHSSRKRKPRRPRPDGGATSPSSAGLPILCLAFLALAGCDRGAGSDFCAGVHFREEAAAAPRPGRRVYLGTLQVPGDIDVLGGTNTEHVRLTAMGSLPAACATPYGCVYYSSVDGLLHQVNAAGIDYASGTAHRARTLAGTPGDVATGWLWHDTVDGKLKWRSPSGTVVIGAATAMGLTDPVISGTITGTYNIGGTPTFTVAPVFGAGATASGAVAFNLSGSSGGFTMPTGALVAGGSSNAFTNAVAFNGGVTLGDAAADIILNKGTWRIENTANTFYVTLTHAATANRAVTLPDAAGAILLDSSVINGSQIGAGDIAAARINAALTAPGPTGSVTPNTGAFTTLSVAGAPTAATFFRTCTLTSAAAATPVDCLAAADVPAALSAKLAKWHAYVNGATVWGTVATCTIEDTAGNDLVNIAVAALTGDTFIDDGSANVTKEARYRLGTGGAVDQGLRVVCDANGTGSDLVFVLSGSIQ